jgi:aminoglycoside/choline kinase family phosphotransferase
VSEIRLSVDSAALKRAFPDSFPENVSARVTKLAGDASSREYYRVEAGGAPMILQVTDAFDATAVDRHPFLSARALLERWSLPVPRCLGFRADYGWVLLEDLGDGTLQNEASLENYRRAVDLMIRWTVAGVDSPVRTIHFDWAFDEAKLQAEMQFTADHLISGVLGRDGAVFHKLVAANSRYLSARPRFFCHRDYHCRNLMSHGGRLYVIDFQDARLGPISYDLVSLLWDPYVRLSESWRDELLVFWRESLLQQAREAGKERQVLDALGSARQTADWKVELERMKVQRLLKAAGSYASFWRNKGRRDYLPSIFPALEDTLQALATLRDLGAESKEDVALRDFLVGLDLETVRKITGASQ